MNQPVSKERERHLIVSLIYLISQPNVRILLLAARVAFFKNIVRVYLASRSELEANVHFGFFETKSSFLAHF